MPKFNQEIKENNLNDAREITYHTELLQKYTNLVNEVNFNALSIEMPYTFISLQAMYETLVYYKNNKNKPIRFGFKRFENVYDFYKKMIDFKKDSTIYFEKAENIIRVQRIVGEINMTVTNSRVLDNNLCVFYNEELFNLANKALTLLPEYSRLITLDFKNAVLNSALHELSAEDLIKLVDTNIIKESNFYSLHPEDEEAIKKMEVLKTYMENKGVVFQSEKIYEIKLAGVTFTDNNNVKRQDTIATMSNALKNKESVDLSLEYFTFSPDLNIPEPAYRVLWNGNDIGNLPKETAEILFNNYKNNQIEVKLKDITGGDKVNYGVNVTLTIQLLELALEKEM